MKNPNLDRFPLGFWLTLEASKAPADQPREWAEMGMSLTMGHLYDHGKTDKEHFLKMLDCAYENGIRMILCDSRASAYTISELGQEEYTARLQSVLDDWGDHPAVWGVHLGDEPNAENYPNFIFAICTLQRLAPHLQPYVNLLPWMPRPDTEKMVNTGSWAEYLDKFVQDSGMKYLSYDCYTQMRSDPEALPIYFRNLKLYGDAARRNGIPFWTILLSVPHFSYRDPSLDDLRWQFYTALASGAKGITWFYLYQQNTWHSNYRNAPVNQLGRKTQGYYNISDIQNIFRRTLAPAVDSLTLKKVYHIGQAYGGFELFTGDEEVEYGDASKKMIMSYFEDENDPEWRYLMLVNNSFSESVHYTLRLRGPAVQAELLTYDDVWVPMEGVLPDDGVVERTETALCLPHWYAPGQAELYRYRR